MLRSSPLRSRLPWLALLALATVQTGFDCSGLVDPTLPKAVVALDRSAHFLDRPYPSDELLDAEGHVVLDGFPIAGPVIGQLFLSTWISHVGLAVRGFSTLTPVYLRFEAPIAVAASYPGGPRDDVRLFSLDSGDRVPLRTRFVADAMGDPYLPDGTLVIAPDETHPLRPGERYVALVSRRLANPAPGWRIPDELVAAQQGFDAAVATVFTVQDAPAELAALREAARAVIDSSAAPLVPPAPLREVSSLRFEQGTTPSGQRATREIVTFADGGTEVGFLDDQPGKPDRTIDLTSGPMRVYEATIHTVAFQDPTGRPYQSPGLGILGDLGRRDGWIAFGPGGAPPAPHLEPVRVVVQIPRTTAVTTLLRWGHGSGGDAYEAIARVDPANDLETLRARIAAAGGAVVSFDQPLFGRRFDLVDRGYEDTLTVVNIPNLPAFRDNVRQGAVDAYVVSRFARDVLPGLLPDDVPTGAPLVAFGHSIGAQIAGVAVALERDETARALLLNGTGGFETHSVLASDLLKIQGSVGELIFALAGITPPPGARPNQVLGALLGVPEAAWPNVDRHHPLAQPFQLIVEGSDPLAVAPTHDQPVTVFYGEGDSFVPEDGAAWIAAASERGAFVACQPSSPYDGHYCVFREETGRLAFEGLLAAP